MDITQEELHSYKIYDILKESLSIAKISPKTFYFITVTLIFPLSFAILAHSLFTHPILAHITSPSTSLSESRHEFTRLLIFEFSYRIFLFTFSLLSTAAIVFTVASLYTSKPVSFTSTLSAIPKVFKRLFITFIWVVALIVVYHLVIFSCMFLFILAYGIHSKVLEFLSLSIAVLMYTVVHVYITALWHLASVVSVLEPVYGLAAMKKSYELLKGRTMMAIILVFVYFLICAVISMTFTVIVVHDDQNCAASIRTSVGAFLVVVLVVVNFVGLLVQSVFYYVCKSYHHQGIDKSALYDQLGGYLGEYVPLKSDIQTM